MRCGLVVGAVLVAIAPEAHAAPSYLERLAATVDTRLDAIAAARAPKLVPPVPVEVRWRATRLGSFDLGAPLVAMTAADLDGNGEAELYAVTSREVVAFTLRGGKPAISARVAFARERAVPAPRDVVGTAVVDGAELVAASSMWAKDLRVRLDGGAVVGTPGEPGFLLCPGERAQLAPGRNHFGDPATAYYGVRCRSDLVDAAGHPWRIRAQLAATGKLAIEVARCAAGATTCEPASTHEYADVGVAYEIADIDRNGTPEVIAAGYVAPGDADQVRVLGIGGVERKPVYKKAFTGGVAGIAVVPGPVTSPPAVIAAVRLAGATRVDLWRLN